MEYDLDHVALYTADPEVTAEAYLDYGFAPAEPRDGVPRVEVGGAYVEFHRGDPGDTDRPLLNHLAVLVDSAEDHKRDAEEVGIEVERVRRRREHATPCSSGARTACASSTSSTSPASR